MTFSPHIGPDLFRLIDELDDGKRPRAEIWREAGAALRSRGLLQPSYERVRQIVNTVRTLRKLERSKLGRAVILTAEFLWATRTGKTLMTRAAASAARSPFGTASRPGGP